MNIIETLKPDYEDFLSGIRMAGPGLVNPRRSSLIKEW